MDCGAATLPLIGWMGAAEQFEKKLKEIASTSNLRSWSLAEN